MITSLGQLASFAYALAKTKRVTVAERNLVGSKRVAAAELCVIADQIRRGDDPLGDAFCALRSSAVRRGDGATYTPQKIVAAMVGWAAAENRKPVRIVDAGAGSGRFTIAAAKAFPQAKLIAVELDPLAALMLRANAKVLGFAHRLTVHVADYRELKLPKIAGATLFIGNPPYVRHHDIAKRWKIWASHTAETLGFSASGLAGLHIHFFLKTRSIAHPGDFGAFITASEWMDVNYGSVLRKMLADGLGGTAVHVIDPSAKPFADALVTGAITCFRVGQRPDQLVMRSVESIDDLGSLHEGRAVGWDDLGSARKWSLLVRSAAKPKGEFIELGEFFRVHRGQVSGKNAVWIEGPEAAGLPERFLFPCVTRARNIIEAGDVLDDASRLKRVIDLPADISELDGAELRAVKRFLSWAKSQDADKGWIATHRRAWWSVNLRDPAPILCTYMARRAPAFARNAISARHLNIAHGLYPVEPLSDDLLDGIVAYLNKTVTVAGGRTYAGGLVKFEPGEVERLHILSPSAIAAGVTAA